MGIRRTLCGVAATLGLAIAGLVAMPGTASADSPRSYHGNDWGQILTITGSPESYNDYIVACDGEVDGHYVYSNYHLVSADGFSDYRNVFDTGGANNGCGHVDYRGTKYWARAVRVCEQSSTCGPWKYIPALEAVGKQTSMATSR